MTAKPQKIGKLTVLFYEKWKDDYVCVCRCECGQTVYILGPKPKKIDTKTVKSCEKCAEADYIFKPNEIADGSAYGQVLIVEQSGRRVKAECRGKILEGLAEDFKGTGVIF
jgi:hypothetical protein